MHFDDRLATVLRQSAGSPAIARVQYRQLLDLLGTEAASSSVAASDAAYLKLSDLSKVLPAATRASILREPVVRLRNSRLLAALAEAEPAVAAAAMSRADLAEAQWLDLVPALPVRARGILRHHRGLPHRVERLLDQLGVHDRALPAAAVERASQPATAADPAIERTATVVSALQQKAAQDRAPDQGIRAIVQRIEDYRKARQVPGAAVPHGNDPRLPLGDNESAELRQLSTLDFATDAEGRVVWADPRAAPMIVGLNLATGEHDAPARHCTALRSALRRRQPVRAADLTMAGAPQIAGTWQVEAMPRFTAPGGRYVGHVGRMHRPVVADLAGPAARKAAAEADRMRQMLHELRTPVNAIQGFAEATQQALFGPVAHEYRALAAAIAGDAARILAAFEELDRLVRLRTGVIVPEAGQSDLVATVEATVAQLDAFTGPRDSGFVLETGAANLPLGIEQGEAERLVWRLLASLASASGPGERLALRLSQAHGMAQLALALPKALARLEQTDLLQAGTERQSQSLSPGMFGTGFALRLAIAEAQAAGGTLSREGDVLALLLPCLPGVQIANDKATHLSQGDCVAGG